MQDRPKVASPGWCSMARERLKTLHGSEMRKKEKMGALVQHLEDEIAQVKSLIEQESNNL
jgi:hypothetical protein